MGQARTEEVWGRRAVPLCWVSLVIGATVLAQRHVAGCIPVSLVESDIQVQKLDLWGASGPVQSHRCHRSHGGRHRSHGDATGLGPHFWHLLFGVMGQQPLTLRGQGAALCGDLGQTPIWKGRLC